MKKTIKSLMMRSMPSLYHSISSYRFSQYCKKKFGEFQNEFADCVYTDRDISVLGGPFKGMRYYNRNVWGPITPKWVGSYEMELHSVVEDIIRVGYGRILDVGAAEGYYAVGFSRMCPESEVFSFDVDPLARKRQAQLSSLNSISNLTIGKYCSHDILCQTLNNHSLLFCDIEGFEYELLDPDHASILRETDILVEVHSYSIFTPQEVRQTLINRFSQSHIISTIQSKKRTIKSPFFDILELKSIEEKMLAEALNEHRHEGQQWLWMKAEQGGALNAANAL